MTAPNRNYDGLHPARISKAAKHLAERLEFLSEAADEFGWEDLSRKLTELESEAVEIRNMADEMIAADSSV